MLMLMTTCVPTASGHVVRLSQLPAFLQRKRQLVYALPVRLTSVSHFPSHLRLRLRAFSKQTVMTSKHELVKNLEAYGEDPPSSWTVCQLKGRLMELKEDEKQARLKTLEIRQVGLRDVLFAEIEELLDRPVLVELEVVALQEVLDLGLL